MTDPVDEYELEKQRKERERKQRLIRRYGYIPQERKDAVNEWNLTLSYELEQQKEREQKQRPIRYVESSLNERVVEAYERSVDNQGSAIWIYGFVALFFIIGMIRVLTL